MEKRDHSSKGIYRTRQQTLFLKHSVLKRWSYGELGRDIATELKVSHKYVSAIIERARKDGDSRAVARRLTSREAAARRNTVSGLWASGMTMPEIAARLDISKGYVGWILARERL